MVDVSGQVERDLPVYQQQVCSFQARVGTPPFDCSEQIRSINDHQIGKEKE
jgi:hypothetical protein